MNPVRRLKTYCRLGVADIIRVGLHRTALKAGLHPCMKVKARLKGTRFFKHVERGTSGASEPAGEHSIIYFGWRPVRVDRYPQWFLNPFNGRILDAPGTPWWRLSDFGLSIGDIKTIWEPSRMDWVVKLALNGAKGDSTAIATVNKWLSDWSQANRPYDGPNWKCGQEASIRIMHLAAAACLLNQEASPRFDLLELVRAHLLRIAPTMQYAIAQRNNHGISETAALFIGGSWCAAEGDRSGSRWARTGRRFLEKLTGGLIAPDGSFSQYSVNYHRLVVDTLAFVEYWRRRMQLEPFSDRFYAKARAAAGWLFSFVDEASGDAPNIGANDGSRILQVSDTGFRDYRPSVQFSMAVFDGRSAYSKNGGYNAPMKNLGFPVPVAAAEPPGSRQFDDGGYSLLRLEPWKAVLKYPRYQFRPKHCDALHLDLWHGSDNLLRDGGSYSYNGKPFWRDYFTGTRAHNTIEFDDRDQMPKLGRFLRGAWLESRDVFFSADPPAAAARYRDWRGAEHQRSVSLKNRGLTVIDRVKGFTEKAVLRWRLQPGAWSLSGGTVRSERYELSVHSSVPAIRREIVEGWESRYYMKKDPIPVLEVEFNASGTVTTEISLRKRA